MDKTDFISATMAIHYLSKYLYLYYGKKVIILLDEYATSFGFTDFAFEGKKVLIG